MQNWIGSRDQRFLGLDRWKIGLTKEWASKLQRRRSRITGGNACNGRDWQEKEKVKDVFK